MSDYEMQERANHAGIFFSGLVFGAMLGAGAMLLSDEKKRKELMNKVHKARNKAADMMRDTRSRMQDMKSRGNDTLDSASEAFEQGEKASRSR